MTAGSGDSRGDLEVFRVRAGPPGAVVEAAGAAAAADGASVLGMALR